MSLDLPGWFCECRMFNGAAKEWLTHCRCCGKRADPSTWDVGAEIDLEGQYDCGGRIRYLGKVIKMSDGKWICLADVDGSLCRVEVRVS